MSPHVGHPPDNPLVAVRESSSAGPCSLSAVESISRLVGPMLGLTRRQSLVVIVALAMGVAVVGSAAVGLSRLALSLMGVLLVGVFVMLIDIRRRQGAIATRLSKVSDEQRRQRSFIGAAEAIKEVASRVISIGSTTDSIRETAATISSSVDDLGDREDELVRKVETSVALERVASAERHAELVEAVADIRERVRRLEYEPVRQVQALMELLPTIEPKAPLPPTGHWALEPAGLLALTHLVSERKPELVVECGSGTSSVWLGYVVQAAGTGRVVSIEHDDEYAQRTRSLLREHSLSQYVDVRTAPLTTVQIDEGEEYQWYRPSAVSDLSDIGILLIDGPPQATGPMARYPALAMLGDKLTSDAAIVIDDANRPDERTMIERWLSALPGLTLRHTSSARVVLLDRSSF